MLNFIAVDYASLIFWDGVYKVSVNFVGNAFDDGKCVNCFNSLYLWLCCMDVKLSVVSPCATTVAVRCRTCRVDDGVYE